MLKKGEILQIIHVRIRVVYLILVGMRVGGINLEPVSFKPVRVPIEDKEEMDDL